MEFEWWTAHSRLWDALVPAEGQATTLQGELIRTTGKLSDEAHRNQNKNWADGFEEIVAFVVTVLNDAETFSEVDRDRIRRAADTIVRDHRTPDISGHGGPYFLLSEMAVRWCMAHPELIIMTP